ncbi:hypothetical protein [Psychrobacillus sp.]|uniref:hypothetical protein n=1 Tax=Psychrobacillus sp. TaxID=1871623 RepID=UPI0028BEFCC4|nr:hypothetical protein [Psychrobacillus sp.]
MEEYEKLQESLKNLTKYSLKHEQKKKILYELREERISRKKSFVMPVLSIIGICSVLLFLILTNGNDYEMTTQQGATFTLPDRNQQVIGVEGKLGILVFKEQFVAKDLRRGSKLMLYYWGDANSLVGKSYYVEAVNTKGKKIKLSEGTLSSGLNSEDAHTLARFEAFPSEGEWQLSFYVEDELFEAFTIEVLPSFPKTEHFTLLDAPKEIPIGESVEITMLSTVGEKQKIKVKLLDKKGNVEEVTFFEQTATFIDGGGLGMIYHYTGKITLKEHGTWRLQIDGEETGLFEN